MQIKIISCLISATSICFSAPALSHPCPEANQIKIHQFEDFRSHPTQGFWEGVMENQKFGTDKTWYFLFSSGDLLLVRDETKDREQAELALQSLKFDRLENEGSIYEVCYYTTDFKNINGAAFKTWKIPIYL